MAKAAHKAGNREKASASRFVIMIKAAALGLLVSTVLLLLFSFLMSIKDVPFALLNPFSSLLLALSSLLAGYLAARKIKARGMLIGGGCGAMIFAMVMLVSFMTRFDVGLTALIKLAICAMSGAVGGISGVNAKTRRK